MKLDGIEITVRYKPIRSLRLSVKPPGIVQVSAPVGTTERTLNQFLLPRLDWIKKHQSRMAKSIRPPLQLIVGEILPLWGKPYVLEINSGRATAKLAETIMLSAQHAANLDHRKSILENWYRNQLATAIADLQPQLEAIVGKSAESVSIRWMKTRWGSCNIAAKRINLNLELVKLDPLCLQYTLTHELCHLIVRGHGHDFYTQMDRCFPRWRHAKALLKQDPIGQSFWE